MKTCKQRHLYTKEEVDEKLANKDNLINELKKQIEVLLTKVGNTTNIQQNIFINPFEKRIQNILMKITLKIFLKV